MERHYHGKEYMGIRNLPEYDDKNIDADGKEWTVKIKGGFYLYDKDGIIHPTMQDVPWNVLASWFNQR